MYHCIQATTTLWIIDPRSAQGTSISPRGRSLSPIQIASLQNYGRKLKNVYKKILGPSMSVQTWLTHPGQSCPQRSHPTSIFKVRRLYCPPKTMGLIGDFGFCRSSDCPLQGHAGATPANEQTSYHRNSLHSATSEESCTVGHRYFCLHDL